MFERANRLQSSPLGRVAAVALVALGLGSLAAGCSTTQVGASGPFKQLPRLETDLKRGSSTKADVQRLLGAAPGKGGTLMPGTTRPGETWVYQHISADVDSNVVGHTLYMKSIHHVLLVFFHGDLYDGFMWYVIEPSTSGVISE